MNLEFGRLQNLKANLLNRRFHIAEESAGVLGLGVKIQVKVEGEVIDEAIVYGDTLTLIRRHVDAQWMGDDDKLIETNEELPKRFRYDPETDNKT